MEHISEKVSKTRGIKRGDKRIIYEKLYEVYFSEIIDTIRYLRRDGVKEFLKLEEKKETP